MAIPVDLPAQQLQPGGTPSLSAGRVAPPRDYRGQQVEQLGSAMMDAGGGFGRVADELQDRLDDAKALQADNLNVSAQEEALDGPNGYLRTVGQQAAAGRQQAIETLKAKQADAAKLLENPMQRDLFERRAQVRMQQAMSRINDHHARQVRVFEDGQLQTGIGLEIDGYARADDGGARGGTVAGPMALHAGMAMRQAEQLADLRGWGPESNQRKALLLDTTTKLHGARVRSLVSQQQPDRARAYLESIPADQIAGDDRNQLHDLVRRGTVADRSARLAAELMAPKPLPEEFAGASYADQFQARERLRGQQAVQAKAEVRARFARKEISVEEHDQALARIDNAQQDHLQDLVQGGLQIAAQGEKWLNDNPKADPAEMPQELQQQGAAYGLTQKWAAYADGRRYSTDNQFLASMLAKSRAELAQEDPDLFALVNRERLNPFDMARVRHLIERAHRRVAPSKQDAEIEELQIKLAAKDVDLDVFRATLKPEVAEQFARFREAVLTAQTIAPDRPLPEILKEMKETKLRTPSGVNFFASPPAEQTASTVVSESGRTIPIASIVDENAQPLLPQLKAAVQAENIQRAARGEPLLPEDVGFLASRWERDLIKQAQQRDQAAIAELWGAMSREGMFSITADPGTQFISNLQRAGVLPGNQWSGTLQDISIPDAMKLTGLTYREIVERGGAIAGMRMGDPTGFTQQSIARVLYDLRHPRKKAGQ